jgi:predicted ATPase
MLSRIDQRLPLLGRGARDQPARLQTMSAAISWSYDLLGPEEQALFRRLSVFLVRSRRGSRARCRCIQLPRHPGRSQPRAGN